MVEIKECSREEFEKYMHDIWKVKNMYNILYDIGIEMNNIPLLDNFIEMLQKLMKDKSEWISYYIYEVEFGTIPGNHVYDEDGNPIPFNSLDDVYDLIASENNE